MQRKFRGDDQWMLPSLSKKIDEMASSSDVKHSKKDKKVKKAKKSKKSSKKHKKEKKSKKSKKRKHSSSGESSDSDGESSEEEKISKRKRKRKHFSDASSSESSDDSEEDAWVEKGTKVESVSSKELPKPSVALERDDWLGGFGAISTFSKSSEPKDRKKDERKGIDAYDPSKCTRELNPYWKDGGDGLPSTFAKPNYDSDDDNKLQQSHRSVRNDSQRQSSWKKKTEDKNEPSKRDFSPQKVTSRRSRSKSVSSNSSSASGRSNSPEQKKEAVQQELQSSRADFLTDQQMNELGAKLVKAEIMGNDDLVKDLKDKLDRARQYRTEHKKEVLAKTFERRAGNSRNDREKEDKILLTSTNSKGVSRPVTKQSFNDSDLWGGKAGRKAKKQKPVETHAAGERVRYFADDDRYDIKQMVSFFLFLHQFSQLAKPFPLFFVPI